MNRQIKFRGRCADGEWAVGIPITTHIRTFIATEENPHVCDLYGYIEIDLFAKADPSSIGQFTGLKDRNGTEIYEGDMLECPQVPNVPLEVYYNTSKGAFCLVEHTHIEGVLKGTTPIGDMLDYYPDMIIIGNIHDNPIEE